MKLSPVRWILAVAGLLFMGFLLLQLIPYGRDHSNPPIKSQPAWDSPRTQKLVREACFDCHSNETRWPWYSNVAPMSWLLARDVEEARGRFNLNEMTPDEALDWVGAMVIKVKNNEMPPMRYSALHAEARFSTLERQDLINGLLATFK